jgi:hypothetical protein
MAEKLISRLGCISGGNHGPICCNVLRIGKLGTAGLLKKFWIFDKIVYMEQARNSTIKPINGMEAIY